MSKKSINDNFQPEDDPDIKALIDQGILAVEGEHRGLDTKIGLTDKGREVGKSLRDKKK